MQLIKESLLGRRGDGDEEKGRGEGGGVNRTKPTECESDFFP